jgi:hypothetical protein
VCIEEAFGMSVAAGGGAEWKQTWPVAPVAADWKLRAHDDAEAVAESMKLLYSPDVVHQLESIAVDVEPTTL